MSVDHPAVALLLGVAAILTALGVIWQRVVRPTVTLSRKAGHFFDDWFGQPERPGREAVPGFPERLSNVEADVVILKGLMVESKTDREDLRARLGTLVAGPDPREQGPD